MAILTTIAGLSAAYTRIEARVVALSRRLDAWQVADEEYLDGILAATGAVTAANINTAITAHYAAGGGTVYVPKCAMTITGIGTDKILLKSKVRLIFEPGCTIVTGLAASTSQVINIDTNNVSGDMSNVQIIGNGLVVTGDRASGSICYGMGVGSSYSASTLSDVYVEGIEFKNFSYDGFTIGGNVGTTTTKLRFHKVKCTSCYRNGASITNNATDVLFTDCDFTLTNGTAPQAGFDIELNDAGPALSGNFYVANGILFDRCRFNGNAGNGLYAQAPSYGTTVRVSATGCEANDNTGIGFAVYADNSTFTGCLARSNTSYGFAAALDSILADCVAESSGSSGYQLASSKTRVLLANCTSRYNVGSGFLVTSIAGSTGVVAMTGCQAFANYGKGFALSGSTNAVITGGSSTMNREDGISFSNSHDCTVTGLLAAGNGYSADAGADNIVVESSSNVNSITTNTVRQAPGFIHTVAVVDAATTTTTVKLSVASATDSAYKGRFARIISGTQSGASGWITGYVGSTKVATVDWSPGLGGAPDGTSVIEVVGGRMFHGTVHTATSTTITLAPKLAPSVSSLFLGAYVYVESGTGAGQARLISAYVGSTRTVTCAAFSVTPDDTSVVSIVSINRPRYGIRVTSGTANRVELNDVYYGGTTGKYSDGGTSTYATAANRVT